MTAKEAPRSRNPLSLRKLLVEYVACRDIKGKTVKQTEYAITAFEKFLDRDATTNDLEQTVVNLWITHLLDDAELARATIKGKRNNILALWREAVDMDLVERDPRRIKPVRVLTGTNKAYTAEEAQRIFSAATKLRGRFPCHVRRDHLMLALLLTMYDTGLRPCDMLELQLEPLLGNGRMVVMQQKTGVPIVIQLQDSALTALRNSIPPQRELAFPISKDVLNYWYRQIRRLAGVGGSPKWLRRTGATQVELMQPGAAMAYLGHKTPGLAYKHYVDMEQLQITKPLPPQLGILSVLPEKPPADERGDVAPDNAINKPADDGSARKGVA